MNHSIDSVAVPGFASGTSRLSDRMFSNAPRQALLCAFFVISQ
jgi:hypothetical protein